jgi:hypothetical protein
MGAMGLDKITRRLFRLIILEANFNKLHSSVYTGAAYTNGRFHSVVTTFMEDEPRAVYTHCHARLGDLMVLRFVGI